MLEKILDDYSFNKGDIVIPFVNGSGSTTLMELLIVYNDIEKYLSRYNIKTYKPLINEYITTQDSGGFSISLLKSNEEMRKLWSSFLSSLFSSMKTSRIQDLLDKNKFFSLAIDQGTSLKNLIKEK